MTKIFSSGGPNFPKDEDDLKNRLAKIAEGLPDQRDNINPFVIPAFELFRDCGLITKENVEILSRKSLVWIEKNSLGQNIQKELYMNPLGGVLRRKGLTMWDNTNLRYYCPKIELIVPSDIEIANRKAWNGNSKLVVICENTTYYISNDWFAPEKPRPTKKIFYNWLAKKAWAACKAKWAEDKKNTPTAVNTPEKNFAEPVAKKVPSENNSEIEKLLSDLTKLVEGLDGRVDNLEKTLSKIEKDIEELKNEWYGK